MDFNEPKQWSQLTIDMTELLDASYKAKKDAEPRRQYVGASLIGHECERFIAFNYHGTAKDPDKGFTGRTYRIFDMGHDGETRMAEYLKVAGFNLLTEREDGRQFGFAAMDGRIKGHIDGVILAGPLDLPYPIGWENKAVGPKTWAKFVKDGVKKASGTYYGQCQMLMGYLDLAAFLFTAINRDTGEVHTELVTFEGTAAQKLSDRAVRIVQSAVPEELPRCTADPTDYRCKWCDYHATCWKTPAPLAAPKPAWLR